MKQETIERTGAWIEQMDTKEAAAAAAEARRPHRLIVEDEFDIVADEVLPSLRAALDIAQAVLAMLVPSEVHRPIGRVVVFPA